MITQGFMVQGFSYNTQIFTRICIMFSLCWLLLCCVMSQTGGRQILIILHGYQASVLSTRRARACCGLVALVELKFQRWFLKFFKYVYTLYIYFHLTLLKSYCGDLATPLDDVQTSWCTLAPLYSLVQKLLCIQ